MSDLTSRIIEQLCTGYFVSFSTEAVIALFKTAFKFKPTLERELQQAKSTRELERVFRDAVGVIDANAETGSITVDGALLRALRGIRFDHQHGIVFIGNSRLTAPILVTGGAPGASGRTTIDGNTVMESAHTSIHLGKGSSITMSGGSSIIQN